MEKMPKGESWIIEKGKLWLRKTTQNAGATLNADKKIAELMKIAEKYLCRSIATAGKVIAELVKTAGKNHSEVLNRWRTLGERL